MLSDTECVRREVPMKCHLFGDSPRARHVRVSLPLAPPRLFRALREWDHSLVFLANPTVPRTTQSASVNSSGVALLSVPP